MTPGTVAPRANASRVRANPVEVRKSILSILHAGKASHLGPSMSVVEMLIAIYSSVDLALIRAKDPLRPRVIISKGHCAAATYSVLAHVGLLDMATLRAYHQDGTTLAGHVSHAVDYVEHSTGALGHGLSVACGCAIGLRVRGVPKTPVFVLLGDGEIQEGSVWEALMFARHHRLTNLVPLIDNNRISSITSTADVIDMNPLKDRFAGFGFGVHEADGHDVEAILDAIDVIRRHDELGVIICNTIKGRGVPFAEHEPIWHYRTLSEKDYNTAMEYLEQDGLR